MELEKLVELLNAKVYTNSSYHPKQNIEYAFSCDLMSDALMLLKDVDEDKTKVGALVTGLVTIQGVRTAEMLDIKLIILVRGKVPTTQVIQLAEELGLIMIGTNYTMFKTSGEMYKSNIKGFT